MNKIALSIKLLALSLLIAFSLQFTALGQFTTDRDTLFIATGDSATVFVETNVDTTSCYDLDGKLLVAVDFDTTSAWTSAKFIIQHSSTYDASADTAGGTPCNWETVQYEGTDYTFTPAVSKTNILDPKVIYSLKRYIRFIGLDSSDDFETEAADRKLVPLIRSGF